jgi:hypothetical protein
MMVYQLRHPLQGLADALRPLSASELVLACRTAGVQPRQARHILRGQKTDVVSFLLLCSGFGVEPTTGRLVLPLNRAGFHFSFGHFGATVALARAQDKQAIRTAVATLGVSTATRSRAEAGQSIGVESLLRIAGGYGLSPSAFLVFTGNIQCNTTHGQQKFARCSLCDAKCCTGAVR